MIFDFVCGLIGLGLGCFSIWGWFFRGNDDIALLLFGIVIFIFSIVSFNRFVIVQALKTFYTQINKNLTDKEKEK